MAERIKITSLTPDDVPTPDLSVRPVSPMHSWMHRLEREVPLSEIIAVIQSGQEPQWHAHNADRWAITVFMPQEVVYEFEGDDFPSRGLMYYIMPDAIEQIPVELRPEA